MQRILWIWSLLHKLLSTYFPLVLGYLLLLMSSLSCMPTNYNLLNYFTWLSSELPNLPVAIYFSAFIIAGTTAYYCHHHRITNADHLVLNITSQYCMIFWHHLSQPPMPCNPWRHRCRELCRRNRRPAEQNQSAVENNRSGYETISCDHYESETHGELVF